MVIPDFQHPQWFVYHMCEITREYLITKISISRKYDWLVLVAVILIYRPPTCKWCLENHGPETEVQLGVALYIPSMVA